VEIERGEVDAIEIRSGGVEEAGQAPGPRDDDIAGIVEVTSNSPESTCEQLGTTLGLNVGGLLAPDQFLWVSSERVLLAVNPSEQVVTERKEKNHKCGIFVRNEDVGGVLEEVERLEHVGERNPCEISEHEHKSKLLGDDIHGSKDGLFVVIVISDVPEMESAHQDHRQRKLAKLFVLLSGNAEVQEDPQDQTRTSLAKQLEVESSNSGVTGKTHPKVVEKVSAHTLLFSLHYSVDLEQEGEHEGPDNNDGDHWAIVIIEDGEGEAKVPQNGDKGNSDPPCQPAIEPVLQSEPTREWASKDFLSRQEVLEESLE